MGRCKMSWEDVNMFEYVWICLKMFEDVYNRPPLLEEPFAQTLLGKRHEYLWYNGYAKTNWSKNVEEELYIIQDVNDKGFDQHPTTTI